MNLSSVDWIIILVFFLITLGIGFMVSRRASQNSGEYFLSGRNMPWWLLGVSMVATTFSADTPNLVTDIVRTNGVAGNWVWWAFLLTGMLTVFVYARLWRRSGIDTDLEFYELRYSGKAAAFLRGFRAIYLGVFFNVIIMATVLLAGIKIASVILGMSAFQTVALVSIITVVYASMGGLRAVILTDFFQFILSMVGMILAAIYIVNLPEVGGLSSMLIHESVEGKLNYMPDFTNPELFIPLFLIPIAVQWWSVWYPGAEPGGGGYVAQRMLSARNERDAVKATLFFNLAHYALRPWPWILIALASLVVFPDLDSIATAFPQVESSLIKHDLAFPAMINLLPKGLLGLVIAALIAALMSTISTHLNWGASYIVKDFVVRFFKPGLDEASQVQLGRVSTVILMILAAVFALLLSNALQAFNILLQIGAGTGLIFILRWFWWRVNAMAEIVAMIVSFIIALYFEIFYDGGLLAYERMIAGIGITSVCWLLACIWGPKTQLDTLKSFYTLIKPYPLGWKPVLGSMSESEQTKLKELPNQHLSSEILMMFTGSLFVYSMLFGIGSLVYLQYGTAAIGLSVSILLLFVLLWMMASRY